MTTIFVVNFISVYGRGWGETEFLLIGLDINVLNIGVFSGPSSNYSPLMIIFKSGAAVVVVDASRDSYYPPPPTI